MRITSLPHYRLGLRWSLLSVAALLAMAAAANYEKSGRPPARIVNLTGGAMEQDGGKILLHGSLSGVLRENRPVTSDSRGMEEPLRPLASMDREWRDLLAERRSRQRPVWASVWKFITGGEAEQAEKEEGSIFGEKVDETFFMDLETLLARRKLEGRPDAAKEEEAEARAASATLRAALLANLSTHHRPDSLAGADDWQVMAEAARVPINVPTQSDGTDAGGDSGVVTTGFSVGDGNFIASNAPSFPPGSLAGDAGGLGGGGNGSPATGSPFPPVPPPSGDPGTFSSAGSTHRNTVEIHASHTQHSAPAPTGSSTASTTTMPVSSNVVSLPTKTVVSSQSVSSTSTQGRPTSPASAIISPSVSAGPTTFSYTGSLQTYTIPVTGMYDITAFGAQGGGSQAGGSGGLGASVSGTILLSGGTLLEFVVGGAGGAYFGEGGAGGGGTFIYDGSSGALYEAAGGGGGAYRANGGAGLTTTSGGNSNGGSGGTSGSGGGAGSADGSGGGGAGWLLAGANSGGDNSGSGGSSQPTFSGGFGSAANGGYGGGGSDGGSGGGGGGGYSGGAGGLGGVAGTNPGGGGGSFMSASFTNAVLQSGVQSGNGEVTILAVPEPGSVGIFACGAAMLLGARRRNG